MSKKLFEMLTAVENQPHVKAIRKEERQKEKLKQVSEDIDKLYPHIISENYISITMAADNKSREEVINEAKDDLIKSAIKTINTDRYYRNDPEVRKILGLKKLEQTE